MPIGHNEKKKEQRTMLVPLRVREMRGEWISLPCWVRYREATIHCGKRFLSTVEPCRDGVEV